MPVHLDFLERHRDCTRAAGPLCDAADGTPAGGLWLVEAETPEAAPRFIKKIRSGRPACASRYACCDGRKYLQTGGD